MRNYNKVAKGTPSLDENIKQVKLDEVELDIKSVPPRTAVVTNCNHLNVRDQPNKYGHAIHVLKAGDIIEVKNIVNGWADIYTSEGVKGYVMKEYIKEG